jgi:hypothetical protein
MGKRGPKPKGRIKIEWSENFAYAIGLIASDGCLSGDGRHIIFVSKDKEQINNFVKCLSIQNLKIGQTFSGYKGSMAYRVQITDVNFYGFLNSIGLTSAKSLTIKKVDIPEQYFFDFLRGLFDGDGCSFSYWDPRWKSSFMFYINFASGSRVFLDWVQFSVLGSVGLKGHISIGKNKKGGNDYYQLKYAKYEAIKLVKFLYGENKEVIKLSRKYLKIMRSLDIVRTHKGRVFVR